MFLSPITVYDGTIFTEERAREWKQHIRESYSYIYNDLKNRIDNSSMIDFFICKSLVDEVIVDAIIGMRKITDSQYNSIEAPNSFKIIAYLTYWWLRHKPVSLHYPSDRSIEDIVLKENSALSHEENELERQKVIWQLKHINELVAVQMSLSYIFDFSKSLCGKQSCKRIQNKEAANFCFESFDDMREAIVKKLTYYYCYRAIAPKVIEHMLEGYTFHPAWGLTGPQWASAKEEGESP